jgi:hypothetical protein
MEKEQFEPDSIVKEITERFITRAKFGKNKYNTTLDRNDLSPEEWAQHSIEEAHDLMLYLTKWKKEQEKQKRLIELLIKENEMEFKLTSVEEFELKELKNWYLQHQK